LGRLIHCDVCNIRNISVLYISVMNVKYHATPRKNGKWDQKRLFSAHFWPQIWWFCTKMHVFESKNALTAPLICHTEPTVTHSVAERKIAEKHRNFVSLMADDSW